MALGADIMYDNDVYGQGEIVSLPLLPLIPTKSSGFTTVKYDRIGLSLDYIGPWGRYLRDNDVY